MRSAGDDRVVNPQAHPDQGASCPFDPGIETGYLRRATREPELDPELGAAPFDPGDAGYDDRRARREAKRRARQETERRERELKEREELDRRRRAALIAETASRPVAPGSAAPAIEPEHVPLPEPAPRPEPLPRPEPAPSPDREAELDLDPAPVAELHALRPRRRSLAERLEHEREERRRQERERRARIEVERAERERAEREARERRRREREKRLRRDRAALAPARRARPTRKPRKRPPYPATAQAPTARRATSANTAAARPRVVPARRPAPVPARPARRPRSASGAELVWPTAKAGIAVTIMLAIAAALGSVLGLPVPALRQATGDSALVSSATLFGVGPGTPQGLEGGYAYPVGGARPIDYGEKAARFGAHRYGHSHEGQDIFAKAGTPLFAVRDGVVIDGAGGKSFYAYGGGHAVAIYSPEDDRSYVYLHMREPTHLRSGDQVQAGQQVGEVGCTGSCDGPHLHFEIRRGKVAYGHQGRPIDPLPYLREWERFGARLTAGR